MGKWTGEQMNAWYRARYADNIKWVQEYKVSKGCSDCGYNKHPAGLEFDHIKSKIRGPVSTIMGRSLKVIKEEIDLCEVVCGTCHRIREYNRNKAGEGNYKKKKWATI